MKKAAVWGLAGAVTLIGIVAALGLGERLHQRSPTEGMTLDQITARVDECIKTGKAYRASEKAGTITPEDASRFKECGVFVRAARNYLNGPIVISSEPQQQRPQD